MENEIKELEVVSMIKQPIIIEYNKEEINNFIEIIENKYKKLIINEDEIKEYNKILANINKVKDSLKKYRISTEKEAKKPIEDFIDTFKSNESKLEILYRELKNQIDLYNQRKTERNHQTMLIYLNELLKENKLDSLYNEFVRLPELKGEFSNSNFKEEKAKEFILNSFNNYFYNKELLEKNIKECNEKYSLDIKIESYLAYLNDIYKAREIYGNDLKACLEIKEQILKQEKNDNIKNEVEISPTESEMKQEARVSPSYIKICLKSLNLAQLQNLKKCLVENNINYIKF